MTTLFLDKSPEQLADDFLHNSPAKVVGCHAFGHSFPKKGSKRAGFGLQLKRTADGGQELSAKCADCGTIRYKDLRPGRFSFWDRDNGYRYDYPDGYLAPAGTGGILTPAEYKEEYLRRLMEEAEHPTGGEDIPARTG